MLPAFLTTIFFSLSVIFATRSARLLGTATANLGRTLVALCLLGLWAHVMGSGLAGKSFIWFFISGCVGYGPGDFALFQSLTRIGPRLTVIFAQCLAAPFAAVIERVWLGTTMSCMEMLCGAVILLGVFMVLAPGTHLPAERGKLSAGALFGVIAGLGQAGGAVLSRKANEVALATGMHVDGGTAAYQRMIGGVLVTAVIYALAKSALFPSAAEVPPSERRRGWMWMLLNGVTGPSLGVACYQWALLGAPSGVVLPIVATTPVATMPLAYLMDGDRPSRRSIVGGVIAVAGSVALALVR